MGAERVKCRNGMSTRAHDPYTKKDTHLAKEHTRAPGLTFLDLPEVP